MTRAEVAAAAHARDLACLSALLDAETLKGAAHALGVSKHTVDRRLGALRERAGGATTLMVVYQFADELRRYREGR